MPQIKEQIKNFLKKDMGERITVSFFWGGWNLRSLRAGSRPCSTFGLKSLHWSDFFTASAFKL
jgi:hypothetical protein